MTAGAQGGVAVTPIPVLVVDDHEVVRLGLRTLLSRQPQIRFAGEAVNGAEAIRMVAELQPQVVLMDVRLPGQSGVEACREIMDRWPEVRVIMLTSYADKSAAMASVLAGASGYMLKHVSGAELIQAIETVARGGSLLDPALVRDVFAQMRAMTSFRDDAAALTDQERQVLALVGEGKTNREIAQAMYLGEKTVRNYVSNILHKLGLSNRSQAAVYATRRKLLQVDGTEET